MNLLYFISLFIFLGSLPIEASEPLTILYSANTRAEMAPCGCSAESLGGLARRATVIKREQRSKKPTLLLDVGDTFFVSNQIPKHLFQEFHHTAASLIQAYAWLHYDKVFLGELDAPLTQTERKKLPILMPGDIQIVEKGSWRILLVALDPKENLDIQASHVREKKKDVNIAVGLAHANSETLSSIVSQALNVDFVINGHEGEVQTSPRIVNGVPVFEVGDRGQYLGRIVLNGVFSKRNSVNQIKRLQIEERLAFANMEHDAPTLSEIQKELERLSPSPKDWYAFENIPIRPAIPVDVKFEKLR